MKRELLHTGLLFLPSSLCVAALLAGESPLAAHNGRRPVCAASLHSDKDDGNIHSDAVPGRDDGRNRLRDAGRLDEGHRK